MKNLPLILSIVAVFAAGASFFVNSNALKEQELKVLAVEKEFKEFKLRTEGQPFTDVANAQDAQTVTPPPTGPLTTVSFARMEHNFGTIKQGDKPKTKFKFTNTGSENLIISNAFGSCGCTVPQYPKEPIAPGATAEIDVEFNSEGKEGEQSKTVTVEANTEPRQTVLTIKSNIVVKK